MNRELERQLFSSIGRDFLKCALMVVTSSIWEVFRWTGAEEFSEDFSKQALPDKIHWKVLFFNISASQPLNSIKYRPKADDLFFKVKLKKFALKNVWNENKEAGREKLKPKSYSLNNEARNLFAVLGVVALSCPGKSMHLCTYKAENYFLWFLHFFCIVYGKGVEWEFCHNFLFERSFEDMNILPTKDNLEYKSFLNLDDMSRTFRMSPSFISCRFIFITAFSIHHRRRKIPLFAMKDIFSSEFLSMGRYGKELFLHIATLDLFIVFN